MVAGGDAGVSVVCYALQMIRSSDEENAIGPCRNASLGARVVLLYGAHIQLVRGAEVKRGLCKYKNKNKNITTFHHKTTTRNMNAPEKC